MVMNLPGSTIRTIQTIKDKNCESIAFNSVKFMLDSMGFVRKNHGSHRIWRHGNGYFLNLPTKGPEIWGYQLSAVRKLINEMEKKGEFDMQVITKQKPELDVMDEFHKMKNEVNISFQAIQHQIKGLKDQIASMQDLMMEIAAKVDKPVKPADLPSVPAKLQMTPKEKASRMHEMKRQKSIKKLEEALEKYPEFKSNPVALAGVSGLSLNTVKKWLKEGFKNLAGNALDGLGDKP